MGTDIHLLAERRMSYNGQYDGWERIYPPAAYRDWPEWYNKPLAEASPYEAVRWAVNWYGDRNYSLFAMLADVRNGSGVAGVLTGEGFRPIAEPRGWPSDPGPDVAAFMRGAEGHEYVHTDGDIYPGDHTPSYLTLAELNAYDWHGQVTRRCGVIPLGEYLKRRTSGVTGPPEAWCGATSGPGIITLEEADVEAALGAGGLATAIGARPYVRVWWSQTYADCAGDFLTRTLPGLNSLVEQNGAFRCTPDDIRIVFNFDS
jgi:hypothetical protein